MAYSESLTFTLGLSVTPTAGVFSLQNVLSTSSFTASASYQRGVTGFLPANSAKNSRLAFISEQNNYIADIYYVTNYGHSTTEQYNGSGYVYEPSIVFLRVIHEGDSLPSIIDNIIY